MKIDLASFTLIMTMEHCFDGSPLSFLFLFFPPGLGSMTILPLLLFLGIMIFAVLGVQRKWIRWVYGTDRGEVLYRVVQL